MKMTKSKFILYSLRILSLFSIVDCLQFVSQFGRGFCLLYPDIITFQKMGPKMCMFACQKNKDCMSINHHKDTLDCQLFSWNSMNISQFETKDNCTHYSSQADPLNTDKCDGAKCADHHTCVDMLDGSDYCVRTECGASHFVNVNDSAGMNSAGSWRSLTCDNGYELSYEVTSQFMICKSNGEWNGTANCTRKKCPEPSAPSNVIIFPGENVIGSTRNVQCNIGYLNVGVPITIECFENRAWTNWTGSCKTCDEPYNITNAVISDGNVTVGSNRAYTCNTGFEDNGESPLITYNESAMWTSTLFSCTIVDCGPPPNIPRTNRGSTGTTYMAYAIYFCIYNLSVKGNNKIICNATGKWSTPNFNCTAPSTAIIDFEDGDLFKMDHVYGYIMFDTIEGPTPTPNTGPNRSYHGKKYRFYESSSHSPSSPLKMDSIDYFSADVKCIEFYYSMYGATCGTLTLKYQYLQSTPEYTLWSSTGDKGEPTWFNAKVTVNVSDFFRISVEATISANHHGDSAIDYIRLFDVKC